MLEHSLHDNYKLKGGNSQRELRRDVLLLAPPLPGQERSRDPPLRDATLSVNFFVIPVPARGPQCQRVTVSQWQSIARFVNEMGMGVPLLRPTLPSEYARHSLLLLEVVSYVF